MAMAFTEQGVAMLIEDKYLCKEIIALDEKIKQAFRYMLDGIDALHQ